MSALHGVAWEGGDDGRLVIVDQIRLPAVVEHRVLATLEEVRAAIVSLAVRGAPAIGIAAAYGMVVHLRPLAATLPPVAFARACAEASERLDSSRPTAVNLHWALQRMRRTFAGLGAIPAAAAVAALLAEARRIHAEDAGLCDAIAKHGSALLPAGGCIYTHCNTGALATGGTGTAIGCLLTAHRAGRGISVIAGETRPLLQGSRLTVPELMHAGVPVRLACDSAAGSLMARGLVQAVIVGADRIAANGDTANKIGTYGLAVLARHHGLPFLVAAPSSTFDLGIADGSAISIEERPAAEVLAPLGTAFAPPDALALNPAFDVTPAGLISALITERGVIAPPGAATIAALLSR